jgi:hypothetical protein
MSDRTTGAQWFRTTLGGNHIAGHGCMEDDYSEKSGCKQYEKKWEQVRFPHDNTKPEELNGPVICYKAGKRDEKP